eukprot:CAMPEP_0175083532 /NCGR_PEP_ID=MMETSP0052_2-20121109/27451_1 /TAXON_ID=51329 ORGANISM="Polytomella parva, Strain SAG 63-3" /NCGR_SAMPLE_ID=MMETSP0052_2 /ASSEMBLY_ACC=CAM_ASM_000194 /LENGTH=1189 /DNA_ID=CAMNT_0016355025 /DNA_START=55 /DNA_END=3620 /DNA_ORIENTATION=-
MSKTVYMRGLQIFISDIRACQNKDQEQQRVDKELYKIRSKFGDDKSLSGYDRRKYIWKLLYIYMLGYDINFGHKQACDLIPMPKYSDKQVGYMACSLLLHENDEFLRLAINAIHRDLNSRNEAFQCLALSFIGTISGAEMAEALTQDVIKLLTAGGARPVVKKRAALCLLRLIRKAPPEAQPIAADTFGPILNALLEERDLGLLLSTVTLLWGILQRSGTAGYETCQSRVLRVLERLISSKDRVASEYLYYGIPSPWLQTKCLRTLSFFPPPESPSERKLLTDILNAIINYTSSEASKNVNPNKANALNAALFEAIAVAMHLDSDRALLANCGAIMARYLQGREPNAKYLALDYLAKLASVADIKALVRAQSDSVAAALRDPDLSIRKKAVELNYATCDARNCETVVDEMLKYLVTADFSIREELVVKIAILIEKFAPSAEWYVTSILVLLERAGDFISAEIWQRMVQLIASRPEVQAHAAKAMTNVLKRGALHESIVCTAAYVLGEYGKQIEKEVPAAEQFRLLQGSYANLAGATKEIVLTALIKIYLADFGNVGLRQEAVTLFEKGKKILDAEVQQKAAEYLALTPNAQTTSQKFVLPMPKWDKCGELSLVKLLNKDHPVETQLPNAPAAAAAAAAAVDAAAAEAASSSSPTSAAAKAPAEVDLLGLSDEPSPVPLFSGTSNAFSSDVLPNVSYSSSSSAAAAQGAAAATSTALIPTSSGLSPPPATAGEVDLLADLFSISVMSPTPSASPSVPLSSAAPLSFMPPPPPLSSSSTSLPLPPSATALVLSGGAYPSSSLGAPGLMMITPPNPLDQHPPSVSVTPPPYGYHPGGYGNSLVPASSSSAVGANPYGFPVNGVVQPSYVSQMTASSYVPLLPTLSPLGVQVTGGGTPLSSAAIPSSLIGAGGGNVAAAAPVAPIVSPLSLATAAAAAAAAAAAVASPSSPPPLSSAPPPQALGSVEHWYFSLLLRERGILYEDTYVQVGLQSRYVPEEARGEVVLFLGNKTDDYSLVNLICQPTLSPATASGLQLALVSPAPAVVVARQQLQVPLTVTCVGVFKEAPTLHLAYALAPAAAAAATPANVLATVPHVINLELKLPILPHKFTLPFSSIGKELFFEQWKLHQTVPCKIQEMLDRPSPLSVDAVIQILRGAGLGVEHGYLDPSPHNEAGASFFVVAAPGGGGGGGG